MNLPSLARTRRREAPAAEINVTPLVDVMLVLLVIFIITAPTLHKDALDVKLPQARGGGGGTAVTSTMTVIVDEQGRVHFEGRSFTLEEAELQLPPLLVSHGQRPFLLKAFRRLPYENVVKVMAVLRRAGVKDVVIAVEAPR